MQLDLLSYQPTSEEMTEARRAHPSQTPLAQPLQRRIAPDPNRHAIAWHEARAAYYLRLINRFVGGTRCSAAVKRHETTRLFELRSAALAEIRRLQGG